MMRKNWTGEREREKGGVVMARRGAGNNIGLLGGKEGGEETGEGWKWEERESCGWALSLSLSSLPKETGA